ncbi:hypothetical protein EV11_0164 [Prochlorococcus sp. SS52]|nr:hypothetical protein EV04_0076 [Prochlorococcus marinus str. LG]KGG22204.1 hypothetical protein EV08_0379 [Prochlorococcus marinus str. SS2]KGG24479.1 hypothetical protein EV09_0110 [Prochlorococcus marinus str. SS35]KGG33374.1 hypothetical protein EV10_0582 [Prochlorococcus marinus str. SS51]KGG37289.1 hypothetical protein EV11_0164 [Prochlorococcus sp. SS52]
MKGSPINVIPAIRFKIRSSLAGAPSKKIFSEELIISRNLPQ